MAPQRKQCRLRSECSDIRNSAIRTAKHESKHLRGPTVFREKYFATGGRCTRTKQALFFLFDISPNPKKGKIQHGARPNDMHHCPLELLHQSTAGERQKKKGQVIKASSLRSSVEGEEVSQFRECRQRI